MKVWFFAFHAIRQLVFEVCIARFRLLQQALPTQELPITHRIVSVTQI